MTLHAYLICEERFREAYTEGATEKLINVAGENGIAYLPIVLATHLDKGGETVVHDVICRDEENRAKVQSALDDSKDFYLAVFTCPTESADNKRLMGLH